MISVCIPTYNQALYIADCINSIIEQTQKADEIIVSNDCSTDNTKDILDQLLKEVPILRVIHQENNMGMVKNTNFCLSQARYDIVIKLDSDDYLLPKYIETLSGLLSAYPQAGYAHGAVQEIDGKGQKIKTRRLLREKVFHNNEEALKSLCSGYKVAANIIMFRKSALIEVGYITSKVEFAEDYYLSVEIANAGYGNVYSPEILSCYRVWGDEANIRQKRKLNEINGIRIIFDGPIKSSFLKRGWALDVLERKKAAFACNQADCLMWNIYSKEEKDQLEAAIFNLSSSKIVIFYTFLYKSGFGNLIFIPSSIKRKVVNLIKNIVASK